MPRLVGVRGGRVPVVWPPRHLDVFGPQGLPFAARGDPHQVEPRSPGVGVDAVEFGPLDPGYGRDRELVRLPEGVPPHDFSSTGLVGLLVDLALKPVTDLIGNGAR